MIRFALTSHPDQLPTVARRPEMVVDSAFLC
jgi:hypothetical protein